MDVDKGAIETTNIVSVAELLRIFGNTVDRAIKPVFTDLQQLRATIAGPLSKMNDQLTKQTIELGKMCTLYRAERDQLEARVKVLETTTKQHEELLREIRTAMKILKWVGTGLGGSILALIWSIITGQVQVSFP